MAGNGIEDIIAAYDGEKERPVVFVVDDEEDAQRLTIRELEAVTNRTGDPEFAASLKDRSVALVPRNDDDSRAAAWRAAEELLPAARRVCIVTLDVPTGAGLAEFLSNGGNRERLLDLVEKAEKVNGLKTELHKDFAEEFATGPLQITTSEALAIELTGLKPDMPTAELTARLGALQARILPLNAIEHVLWRAMVILKLSAAGFASPATLADALLPKASSKTDKDKEQEGHDVEFENLEPSGGVVDGEQLLEELSKLFTTYLVLPLHGESVLALWTVFTYVFDEFNIAPLLTFTSPLPECAKSRGLELLSVTTYRPLPASNISPASIFRSIDAWHPTLLIDEYDAKKSDEELRGIVNSGHARRFAFVIRTVIEDKKLVPRRFSTWGPKAIGLIGNPALTIASRSIFIRMRRRRSSEKIDRLFLEQLNIELRPLREKLLQWARDNSTLLRAARPVDPAGLEDRRADNWRPLLAIADLVGGRWPDVARTAATAVSGLPDVQAEGVMLLSDLRDYFATISETKVTSETLATHLGRLEHRPWPEWVRGEKPLTKAGLAALLGPFKIGPKTIRIKTGDGGSETAKGYEVADFIDAFERYLPPTPAEGGLGGFQPSQRHNPHGSRAGSDFQTVTTEDDVTVEKWRKPLGDKGCDGVTVENGGDPPEDVRGGERICSGFVRSPEGKLVACRAVVTPWDVERHHKAFRHFLKPRLRPRRKPQKGVGKGKRP